MIYSSSAESHPSHDHILGILTESEPLTAQQLAGYAQVSQPTVSRAIASLGERILRIGAYHQTRYALKKDILGLPASHALVWNGPNLDGNMPLHFGRLTYLQDDWLHVRSGAQEWLTRGELPWFLTPLQPKGFLGRALAKTRPDLPADPAKWSLAQILHIVITHTHDPIGAFVLNVTEPRSWPVTASASDVGAYFDSLASLVEQEQGARITTSAGGEQPKFTTHQQASHPSIVKFTTLRSNRFKALISERMHSLLMLEHLALQTLASHGVACAPSRIIHTERRTYLQSERFDRLGNVAQHAKRHVVSLEALHNEFVTGHWESWTSSSEALNKLGLLSEKDLRDIVRIQAFGNYILNNDMHWGNLSFFVDDVVKPLIAPAPVYDMLPMMWRPSDMSDSPIGSEPRIPSGYEQECAQARAWAIEFWTQAQQLDIGADLQAAAKESARRLTTKFASQ